MLPHQLACKASALLVCHDPKTEMQKEECGMKKWRVALVLPQASWVLEARLRRLALDANSFIILHSAFFIWIWCGCRESHPDLLLGKELFCC